jgi:hypothetical protein
VRQLILRRSPRPGYTVAFVLRSPKGKNMKTFEVSFRYQDRNDSSEGSTIKLDASNLPGAIAKATREFVKGLDRKQRFDMNKHGLEIKAVGVKSGGRAKEGGEAAEPAGQTE